MTQTKSKRQKTKTRKKRHSLADGTPPRAPLAVQLQVGLQVEALYVLALVPPGGQRDPLEGDGTLEGHLERRLLDGVPVGGARVAEVPLDLGDAVVGGEQALAQQALQHRPDARPVDQLQHEQVALETNDSIFNFQFEPIFNSGRFSIRVNFQFRAIFKSSQCSIPVNFQFESNCIRVNFPCESIFNWSQFLSRVNFQFRPIIKSSQFSIQVDFKAQSIFDSK